MTGHPHHPESHFPIDTANPIRPNKALYLDQDAHSKNLTFIDINGGLRGFERPTYWTIK